MARPTVNPSNDSLVLGPDAPARLPNYVNIICLHHDTKTLKTLSELLFLCAGSPLMIGGFLT